LAKLAWPVSNYRPSIDAGDVLSAQLAGARHWGGWLVVVALTGLGGVCGTAAAAQAPSYHPDSPAGTEYAIPLDEARKTGSALDGSSSHRGSSAAQTRRSSPEADSQSALFGEGVAPAKRSGKSAAAVGTTQKPSRTTTKAAPAASAEVPVSGHLRPAASGISGTAVALGTGGLVLALGAALTGAVVLSRRVPRSR
jgi:hypothetical protein